MRYSRLRYALTSMILCGSLLLSGCNAIKKDKETETEDKRLKVSTQIPEKLSLEVTGDFIGTVEGEQEINVVSKIGGDVTATFFEVGDTVNEGDLLYTIDDTSAQISYKIAAAGLSTAEASLGTAQAGVKTANANVNSTNASVMENYAKTNTTDKQLKMSQDAAVFTFNNTADSLDTIHNNLEDMEQDIIDVDDEIGHYKAKKKAAKKARDNAAGDPDLYAYYNSIYKQYDAAVDQLEDTKETLLKSKDSLEKQYNATSRQQCLNEQNMDITSSQKSDYDNYTKTTIGLGGVTQIAQAEAGVVQAEAGVKQSQAGITQASANVDAAKLQLDYTKVTAPVSGVIVAKNVTEKNMTGAGSVAYKIISDATQYVTFYVSENVMTEINVGDTLTVDRNGNEYEAKVTENSGVADATNGLFKIKAQLETAEPIINGTKVKITASTKHADNVLTLPIDCIYYESEQPYVYTVENGKAKRVNVTTGISDDRNIEIVEGLSTEDSVITTWSSDLRDGIEVNAGTTVSKAVQTTQTDSSNGGILVERLDN